MEQGTAEMTHLQEAPIAGKVLGRHIHHDDRSWAFPADQAKHVATVRHRGAGLPLNQEAHTCCTAHALCAVLNSASDRSEHPLTESAAVKIYEKAKHMAGTITVEDDIPGSSALMACKASVRLGLISSYRHAFGIEHALRSLTLQPVMTGFSWFSSFDHPDPSTGLVSIADDATVRGGHEVLADGIDLDRELVWFCNSWGPEYGVDGRFCMTFETWARLLAGRGDVTVPLP
jgi:hypothetical protein